MRDFEKDFEEWLFNSFYKKGEMPWSPIRHFNDLSFSMQWGVYVDFFMDRCIYLSVIPIYLNRVRINLEDKRHSYRFDEYMSLNEAREAALEKAKEIYKNKI